MRITIQFKDNHQEQSKLNKKQSSKVIIKDNQHNSKTQLSQTIKNNHQKQSSKTINTQLKTIIKSNQSKTSGLLVSFDTTCWAC